jgi:CheY-like chemotaxis protein
MSPEVRGRIFEPFFTTKASGQGNGLGLCAVHGTLRNHHGAILVHSRPGEGSCFELLLPALAGARKSAAPGQSMAAPTRLCASVLLADDEPLIRTIVSKMLSRAGCEVRVVTDGDGLLKALGEGPTPDLIVTDLVMPGLSCKQLLMALEAAHLSCPLLLMTGYTGEDVSELLGDIRCSHQLLRKPFSQAELLQAVEQLLAAHDVALNSASA